MPTIITHTAVPLAIGLGLGSQIVPRRLLLAGFAASMVPDLDVIGLKLGIAYAEDMGHRGITHSLLFALLTGVIAYALAGRLKARPIVAGLLVFASCASHGLLDMCTNGGLGIAYLWPLSHERYFLPWQLIQVSPLSLDKVFSEWGLRVIYSELRLVWLPSLLLAGALAAARFAFINRLQKKIH
jgi:inner membrane protein